MASTACVFSSSLLTTASSHGNGYQMHYKPLQRSRQPGLGLMLLGALSTHTQELLLPQCRRNFRRTVETHLLFSSKFSSAANSAVPSIHSRMQQGASNPAPGKESCLSFCSLCLSGWRGTTAFGYWPAGEASPSKVSARYQYS